MSNGRKRKNILYQYYSYQDLSRLKAKSRYAKSSGVCVETYRIEREATEYPASKEYAIISKMDVNAYRQLVEVHIEIPQYVKDGTVEQQSFSTFPGRYSNEALLMMREDFLDAILSSDEFARKYHLHHASDAINILKEAGFMASIEDRTGKYRNLWLIRYEYRHQMLTFCIGCDSRDYKHYTLFTILSEQDIPGIVKHLKKMFPVHPERVCIGFSKELCDELKYAFPDVMISFDHYQDALAFQEASERSGDRHLKSVFRSVSDDILWRYGLNTTNSLHEMEVNRLQRRINEAVDETKGHKRDAGVKYLNEFLKKRSEAYSIHDETQLYEPCFREPVPYRIHEMMHRIIRNRKGTCNYSPERMRLILLHQMAQLNSKSIIESSQMGIGSLIATPATMNYMMPAYIGNTTLDLKVAGRIDDLFSLTDYYAWYMKTLFYDE